MSRLWCRVLVSRVGAAAVAYYAKRRVRYRGRGSAPPRQPRAVALRFPTTFALGVDASGAHYAGGSGVIYTVRTGADGTVALLDGCPQCKTVLVLRRGLVPNRPTLAAVLPAARAEGFDSLPGDIGSNTFAEAPRLSIKIGRTTVLDESDGGGKAAARFRALYGLLMSISGLRFCVFQPQIAGDWPFWVEPCATKRLG